MKLYVTSNADLAQLENLHAQLHGCGETVVIETVEQKISQKWLMTAATGSVLLDEKLYLIAGGMKVSPNWQALQQRVVKAGKKSELLLKIAKLQAGMTVIDATAGFGHDSLILASTGARVTMIEQSPLLYLLLTFEQQTMQQQPNWQKLMARLDIRCGQAVDVLPTLPKADVVYLDPMFPANSYKSAVSKTMQLLHELVAPPTLDEEMALFTTARQQLTTNGVVIVKRPKNAPFLANLSPTDSVSNDAVRFDKYY